MYLYNGISPRDTDCDYNSARNVCSRVVCTFGCVQNVKAPNLNRNSESRSRAVCMQHHEPKITTIQPACAADKYAAKMQFSRNAHNRTCS